MITYKKNDEHYMERSYIVSFIRASKNKCLELHYYVQSSVTKKKLSTTGVFAYVIIFFANDCLFIV